jgi:H+/Cl- antiporter ClcA
VIGKWLVFAAAVALVTIGFVELTHAIKHAAARYLPRLPWRLAVGGVAVVLLWRAVGNEHYLGLGVPMIVRAFDDPQLVSHAFALKVLFTAITIGCGFIGGEVTPLFFVGATLGNALSRLLQLPLSLGAGVGMAAVFAAASNAPLALSIMTLELIGVHAWPHALLVCAVAFVLSGHRGIYGAQRVARTKLGQRLPSAIALRDWAQIRQSAPMPSKGPE